MSPEAPGNLVALDISCDASGFACRVERYDPTDAHARFLRVSWNAIARPPGYEPVAGGAAYVDVPPGFDHRTYEARPDIAGPRLAWLDKVFGDGLMLIAVLPYGHALPSFHDADPPPVAAKLHEGRMVIYWLLAERTMTTWRMEVVDAGRIPTLCSALNQEASRQDRRPLSAPVSFINHAATRQYPPGLRADEAMVRFHDLCAWIGERGGDEAQISFTGVLLTFLVADDPISRWFQNYVGKRNIAVADMLSSKGFASQASLETLAAAYAPSGATMGKKPWTPSAREVLTASDALAQRVGGDGCAIGLRHVMGAYCHFHYHNHEAQLRRWGFDLPDWLSEYRKLLKTSDLSPAERAGWHALFKEMGITDRDGARNPQPSDPAVAATPAGWDIFIAHASSDKASAEQLYDRLEAGGHRVFLDARTLKPGDFWDLEIPRALATSRIIVVLVASSYESAHYLRAEIAQVINRARQTGSPRVVPVYVDGLLPAGVDPPYGLGVVQAIDARAAGGLGAVAAQLEGLLP
jgi:TIR domain